MERYPTGNRLGLYEPKQRDGRQDISAIARHEHLWTGPDRDLDGR